MKALSIKQPWAWLLINERKTIEIRTWKTRYRGPVLIHSSMRFCAEGMELFADGHNFTMGSILGVMEIVDCKDYEYLEDFYDDYDKHLNPPEWYDGRQKGIILKHLKRLWNPIPYKGQLGLWECPITLEDLDDG